MEGLQIRKMHKERLEPLHTDDLSCAEYNSLAGANVSFAFCFSALMKIQVWIETLAPGKEFYSAQERSSVCNSVRLRQES